MYFPNAQSLLKHLSFMLLTFLYKDNSTRILRPTESFFPRDRKKQIDIKQLTENVKALTLDTGLCANCCVYYGDELLLTLTNERNTPYIPRKLSKEDYQRGRAKRKELLKELKPTLKNPIFTSVYRNGSLQIINQKKAA